MPFYKDTQFATLLKSRGALVALATLVILAVAGTTWGYSSLSTSVTLSLDGESKEVTAMGDTVADVLESEASSSATTTIVGPSPDEQIDEAPHQREFGAARPELAVHGDERTVLGHLGPCRRRARRDRLPLPWARTSPPAAAPASAATACASRS